ncbi:exodeoxyribonuclease I [Candidatus Pantoea deserta]|uniref:Exodeoxyribonuclease I n=1 Tax=Candidatus Pantoea deserta TaxID=1869313 RepID=A0A3N4PHL3_9GAMM|nr:exodeoxyribonuclease I [Pantoea deserta]
MPASERTFLFHDYETFGKSPSLDRPAQFAALRTDSDFNPVGDPQIFYCRPADDYLPQPEAVMITGITPQVARARGVSEAEFAARIYALFTEEQTCVVGYNNVRFDDEVTRNIFYRNFYDPYGWSWQNGNSRWDLLDVMRACYALRPDGIVWPENEDGFPSFKLEQLTKANGVAHENAHDAMSDVYATLAMAKLVKEKQPKLFEFLFTHRNKNKLMTLIDIPQMKPLVHVSGMFGAARGNTSWVVPLAWHPDNRNALIVADLAGDMAPLLALDADALRERLYTRKSELGDESSVPIKLVHINKCPVLAPANTLRPEDAARLGIDRDACLANLTLLRQHTEVREKVVTLFAEAEPFTPSEDVDAQLYDGFFSDADRAGMNILRQTAPANLPAMDLSFQDARVQKLLFRYRARNFPGTLDDAEQQRWLQHRREALNQERVQAFLLELESLASLHEDNAEKMAQLKALYLYAQELVS